MRKKLFTFLLALATSVGMSYAAPNDSGSCGDNVTYSFNGTTGEMVITGTGPMTVFSSGTAPWKNYKADITSVVVEDGVTSVSQYSFGQCTNLTTVVIGNDVETIGQFAFNDCGASFTSLTLGSSLKSVGMAAFLNAHGITTLTLPDGFETVGDYAFCRLEALQTLNIPSSVTSIGVSAFYRCYPLATINCAAVTPPSLGDDAFGDIANKSNIPLNVPNGSVAAYEAAAQWTDFDIQGYDPAPGGGSTPTGNSITINESSHGSVVASSSSAAAGETITLTATPDDGYQLKSISGVYEAQATSSETLNATSETVNGNKFQAQATSRNNYGWRVYNPGTANTLTVSSKDGATLITKIEFTSTWGNGRANNMLSVSAGTLSFNGTPATTVTINDINATSVTISGSGINAGQTWCISSVKVYYTATIENELEISDTENANVKTFTMVDSEVTISAEFEPAPAPTPSVNAARFVYNYDCQRSPAYPQAGSPCNLSGFSDPLVGYKGIGPGVGNKALGPWKLEFVGYYTPSNHYGCEYRVISAVNSYYPTLSDEEKQAKCLDVPIFRLWQYNLAAKEYQHASYGIICAYAAEANAQDHGALFISSESWGCFLTGHQHTSSFQISCENDLTTGMADLVAAASASDPDLDAVLPVIVSIDAIGDVELTQFCKDQIEGSRAAYNALTDEQKAQITNYSTLTDAETQWATLAAAAQPYADAVIDLINAIPNPVVYTQDCKDKIDAAQAAYDALTDGQKILVSNYETLKNAPSDLINAAPYVHILFKANGNEKKVENVTLPKEFTDAEMKAMLKELYGVEGDYDMYAYDNSNADAVNISYGDWTIYPFMGEVNVHGNLDKFDPQTGYEWIDFSLEISLELPPFGSAPAPTAVEIGDPNNASEVTTFLSTYDGQTIDELIIDRPVLNNMYNTLCLPFDMNAAQIAASSLNGVEIREFTGASVEGTTLNLSVGDPVNAVVAGRPYFVKYSAASQLDDLHFEDVTINNALLDNMAVTFDGVTFKGTFTPFLMPNGLNFQGGYLFLGENNQLFWPNTSNPLKPFRAYFYVNVESSTPGNAPKYRGMPARIVEGKNVATGVENAQSANQSTKVIVNGQLIIIKNDVRYNAQGQIVK